MNKPAKYLVIISGITVLFCLTIGFDILPFLRGPAPYPPEWQWSYLFINTLSRIYLPILCVIILISLYLWTEKKNMFSKKDSKLFIFLVMLLAFLFQLSLLFFSRSGVTVLLHRIIDPELNGYFTASLSIQNINVFLKNYKDTMLSYVYHAKSHPPGAILLFYFLKQLITPFNFFINFANNLNPAHSDVKQLWNILLPINKATALFAAFFIPFLSTFSLIPLYFSAKILYGTRVALRSIFLFFLIPTIVFFIPINDAFLHLFSITAFFFLLKGLEKKQKISFFLSGLFLLLGVLFNLSLIPILILLSLFALLFLRNKKTPLIKGYIIGGIFFSLGFFLPLLFLNLFFHFNFLQVIQTITKYAPGNMARSYSLWIYYNLQDFLIFCGIPIAIIFFLMIKQSFLQIIKKQFKKLDPLFISFFIMIISLNFSGFVLGEVGRLWSPYIPFMILITVNFVTNKLKFSDKLFAVILVLQVVQLLVMQEFWVMLW